MTNTKIRNNMQLDGIGGDHAHQLRAPLSNIIGLIELLESETTNPVNAEIIDMLKKSASALDTATKTIIQKSSAK